MGLDDYYCKENRKRTNITANRFPLRADAVRPYDAQERLRKNS